jgi:hypothetical protein
MRKLYFLFIFFINVFNSKGQIINEFEPNPAGTDPTNVSIELKGTPSEAFSGWIISIENDGANGMVDRAANVSGSFDSNGLLVVSIPDLENPSFTIVLLSDFTGTAGVTDIDTNDDGVVDDTSTFGLILDAIGSPDSDEDEITMYGEELGGADMAYVGSEPALVFRDATTNELYAIDPEDVIYDVNATTVLASAFDFDPTLGNTFGSVNPEMAPLGTDNYWIEDFNFSPNPTSLGYIKISNQSQAVIKVNVYNILGGKVLSGSVSNNRLDVSSLHPGVYIMQASQDNASITKKLVIR